MNRSYKNKLLREAARNPGAVAERAKFWKLEWWPHYLRRCSELVFDEPQAALAFTRPAPKLAAKIAAAHPGANGADLLLLAQAHLGSAFRAAGDFDRAEEAFRAAAAHRASASPAALAEYLRRLAYLRIVQQDAECFPLVEEAITIHKRGNLVNRHGLGECLVCRGHAYVVFGQHGKSFDDWSAALNHLSLKIDDKPWFCALHNLATWAADHGTDEQLETAHANLKPALTLLYTYRGRTFAKLKLRWLMAVIDARLGRLDRAEAVYLEVRDGLVKLKLTYEIGMLQVDLGLLYLAQGRHGELVPLARETAAIFRRIGVEAKVQEALDLWRQAEEMDEDHLKQVRQKFAAGASMMRQAA